MNNTCAVCGKPMASGLVCSGLCRRLWSVQHKIKPMQQKVLRPVLFDVSKIPNAPDRNIQLEVVKRILDTFDIEYECNKELLSYTFDICIESKKLLISVSDTLSNNMYVLPEDPRLLRTKLIVAEICNYRCIHIYDWDDPAKIILSLLPKTSLNLYDCVVRHVDNVEASNFYSMYSLDLKCKRSRSSDVHIGLYHSELLIQCMTFNKLPSVGWKLIRMATDFEYEVIKGYSKIFDCFIDEYDPNSVLAVFDESKHSKTDYLDLGFRQKGVGQPVRVWSQGIQMMYNHEVTPSDLNRMFGLVMDDKTSRDDMMLTHGWLPVYIPGRSKYVWTPKNTK